MDLNLVRELRAKTQFGMNDCKNALQEAEGDMEKAIEFLQKKGLRKVENLVESREGECRAFTNGVRGSIVEVNCQTDFAARSGPFQKFLTSLGSGRMIGFDDLPQIEEEKKAVAAVLRESVFIRRVDRLSLHSPNLGAVYAYNHPGGRIAVLVSVIGGTAEEVTPFAEHVAMHIAATNPSFVHREEVPVDLVQKQKELLSLDLPQGKKPEQLEKILEGKMNRWFGETILMEQKSVVTPDKTIKQVADKFSVLEFRRFERGEVSN